MRLNCFIISIISGVKNVSSNCNFEIVSSSKILPITLYMSSIPTFKNVKSNTIEKIFIGGSQSINIGYTPDVITDNIINEPIWNNIFELSPLYLLGQLQYLPFLFSYQ